MTPRAKTHTPAELDGHELERLEAEATAAARQLAEAREAHQRALHALEARRREAGQRFDREQLVSYGDGRELKAAEEEAHARLTEAIRSTSPFREAIEVLQARRRRMLWSRYRDDLARRLGEPELGHVPPRDFNLISRILGVIESDGDAGPDQEMLELEEQRDAYIEREVTNGNEARAR